MWCEVGAGDGGGKAVMMTLQTAKDCYSGSNEQPGVALRSRQNRRNRVIRMIGNCAGQGVIDERGGRDV